MSFLSKLFNAVVTIAEEGAKKVDRMSDSEIENKFNTGQTGKTVQDFRDFSTKAHELSSHKNNNK